jgi:hypothetical protein
MSLIKVILYICVTLFITNLITQNDRKLIKQIPILGNSIAAIKNLNLYIIIVCLVILIFLI